MIVRGLCLVRMNGAPRSAGGGLVSLTRLVTALRKSLVKQAVPVIADLDRAHKNSQTSCQRIGKSSSTEGRMDG